MGFLQRESEKRTERWMWGGKWKRRKMNQIASVCYTLVLMMSSDFSGFIKHQTCPLRKEWHYFHIFTKSFLSETAMLIYMHSHNLIISSHKACIFYDLFPFFPIKGCIKRLPVQLWSQRIPGYRERESKKESEREWKKNQIKIHQLMWCRVMK